jgi:TonB-linked SusC/RagA family outer membrane protein
MQDFYLSKVLLIVRTKPKLKDCASCKILAHKQTQRIMRLTAFLLLTACLQVNAIGFSQKVTLSVKNAHLVTVFELITKQTGYRFFYNKEQVGISRPVTMQIKDASLEEALASCFRDQPLSYTIVSKVVVIKEKLSNASRNESLKEIMPPFIDVRGKVINERGEPVEGVTVKVKGGNKSTLTNSNGEFSLSTVENDAVLVFTHVSMEVFELKVSGKTELVINLKTKVAALGDVQIVANTGYQTVKPNETNGSFSVIDNKTLNQQVGTNILKRLEGVTQGVLFDSKPLANTQRKGNITIRGFSSINGPMDPLIILDGFIYDGDINNINPNTVDNITILKDAAAASIWGARAGNGVIVITTKKGNFNQKLQIDVNTNVIISYKPDLFYLPQMSSNDYIDVEQYLYQKGYFNSFFTNTNRPGITPAVEIFRKRVFGQISASDSANEIDQLKQNDIRNEYNKYFYTNAVTQQYAINLRGGSNISAYTLSVGFDRNLSELHNQFNKLNIKVEDVFRPIKNLETTIGVYYTSSKNVSGRPSFNSIGVNQRRPTYLTFTDENGDFLSIAKDYREVYTDTAGAGKLLNWKYFPLEDYKHDKTTTDLNELFANFGVKYKVFKFLNIDLKYQYQKQQINGIQLQDKESYGARSLINQFSQLNRISGVVTYTIPKGGIRTVNQSELESHTGRAQMNINHNWRIHEISSILGSEIRQLRSAGTAFTTYGYNADPLTFGNVDFTRSYPNFVTGFTQFIPGAPTYSPEIVDRFISFYGNVAYTLKRLYSISFSGRRDGSNSFGTNTNDKWKPLWSAGLGWNLSNESFYRFHFIPYLRIRTTYGYSGNVDLRKSALPVQTYGSNNSVTSFPTAFISQINDPELRWEKVGTFNIGVDFSLLNRILSGSIDYYRKNASDLYGPTPYDYTTFGFVQTVTKNVAKMEGNGLEINVISKNIDKGFKWNTNYIFNLQDNKTKEYYTTTTNPISDLLFAGNKISPVVGKPLYAIAAYKWGGLDVSGNPQSYVNGQLSSDYAAIASEGKTKGSDGNIVYIGSALPKAFGSLINTFSYKNLSISVNFIYKVGYYFRRPVLSYSDLINNGVGNKEYEQRWKKPGDEAYTNVPSFVYPNPSGRDDVYAYSEINVLKGDHIRLQYINASYSINKSFWRRNPFNELQVYINASNLGVVWRANKENLDPEYPSSLQPLKSWAFGIRATF